MAKTPLVARTVPIVAAVMLMSTATANAQGAAPEPPPDPGTGSASEHVTHPGRDFMGSTVVANDPTQPQSFTTMSADNPPPGLPGLDVSNHQGDVDWSAVAQQGAEFAFMKATEGVTYVDPYFDRNFARSAEVGLIRGAYHFGLPDVSSGAEQARYFLAHGGGWRPDGQTLPPVLDIEYNPYIEESGKCYGKSQSEMRSWISDFVDTMHTETGRWPLIYTTAHWWSMCTGDDTDAATNSPLWIARYTTEDSPGELPAGWDSYSFWQYHAGAGGFPGNEDVFNGTRSELVELAMRGPIVAHYEELGGSSSFLGEPVGEVTSIAGGRMQRYEHGRIYWSPATGAHLVWGWILHRYLTLGGPSGMLGFPTTDELIAPDGVGRYNDFSGTGGGSIYWTPETGAHAVYGAIYDTWSALGKVAGPLGYPTTDEADTSDGRGRFNDFAGTGGGSIYWTPATGAHAVYGAIHDRWSALGRERSRLGYPTSNEHDFPGGRASDYEHGIIRWYRDTGDTSVTYY